MHLGIYRNISGNYRQNAREFRIGIIGNSRGIFGQALPSPPSPPPWPPWPPPWLSSAERRRWSARRQGPALVFAYQVKLSIVEIFEISCLELEHLRVIKLTCTGTLCMMPCPSGNASGSASEPVPSVEQGHVCHARHVRGYRLFQDSRVCNIYADR